MNSDENILSLISELENTVSSIQNQLHQTDDFDEMCRLINEISSLGSKILDLNIKLQKNGFNIYCRMIE